MQKEHFSAVSIIGVGLIGGSLALALKNQGIATTIIGYGRDKKRLQEATRLGIIDCFTNSLKDAASAELIVLATPLGTFEKILKEISSFLKPNSIIMDVGSVKLQAVRLFENILPDSVNFIPAHPIAGSEKTGFENARQDLFKNAKVIITPTERTDKTVLKRIIKMWQATGASTELMSAKEHDLIYGLMSHLPHLLAFCMVNTVDIVSDNLIKYAGSGFKDFTRIAMSSPEIWKDIFLMNRENILKMLDLFIKEIEKIKRFITEESKEDEIINYILRAKKLREQI